MKYRFVTLAFAASMISTSGNAQERQFTAALTNFSLCLLTSANFAKQKVLTPERFEMLVKGSCFKEQREFESQSVYFLDPPISCCQELQQKALIEAKDKTKATVRQIKDRFVSAYLTWYIQTH